MLDWNEANALSKKYGNSFFVLDLDRFRKNFRDLRDAFLGCYPNVSIGYSYKTNYTPALCRIIHELGGFAEVVSEMEYALAKKLKIPGARTIFNGPYKSEPAFEDAALSGATINLDGPRDLRLIGHIAEKHANHDFGVVIRCNFELNADEISRFGMDVNGREFKDALQTIEHTSNIYLKGLHCHFPDRDLGSFEKRAHNMVKLVRSVFRNDLPEVINIGGGYFSDMPEKLRATFDSPPATFADYGRVVGEILTKAFSGAPKMPELFIEPGTAVVANTQSFYTRVIDTKSVRGRNIATVAGSIYDISPNARSRDLPVTPLYKNEKLRSGGPFDVVGYTCIEKDILSERVDADLSEGDFLCYENVGSYSVVMKPPFILPANPILGVSDGEYQLLKQRETVEDVFRNFII